MVYYFSTLGNNYYLHLKLTNNYSISNRESLAKLGEQAESDGYHNVAFSCFFQLNDVDKCLNILLETNKIPEASLFCRTYCPSKLEEVLEKWNAQISEQDKSNRTSNINF